MRKLHWYDFVKWPADQKDKYLFLVDTKNFVSLYEKGNKVDEKKYNTELSKRNK